MNGSRRIAVAAAVAVLVGIVAAPAGAAPFAWSGEGALGSTWSSTSNWVGGTAPSGAVESLTFPHLSIGACLTEPGTDACFESENDIAGLKAESIAMAVGSVVYRLGGDAIELGAGGISLTNASAAQGGRGCLPPLNLSAPQTWTLDGGENFGSLSPGVVEGAGDAVHVELAHRAELLFGVCVTEGDMEVGPVTITGANPSLNGFSSFENGNLGVAGKLNATDGQPVSLTDASLFIDGATGDAVGPLTTSGDYLQLGNTAGPPSGTLDVEGPLTLDAGTELSVNVQAGGTTAGVDYPQIAVAGTARLENARLRLLGGAEDLCPSAPIGSVYTLVTSTAAVEGTFAGLPDGATTTVVCNGTNPTLQLHYAAHAVTATVVAAKGGEKETEGEKGGGSKTTPPPEVGRSATTAAVTGTVRIRRKAGAAFEPLASASSIPFGVVIDATHGSVTLVTAVPGGKVQTITFSEGEFVLTQSANGAVTATLTGGDFSVCPTARERAHRALADAARKHASPKHVVRKLWADGHGKFSTRGNYAAAAVQGTRWLTEDLCDGTFVRVARDKVRVTNLVNHRHKIVKAPHSYLAKAP